MLESTFVFYFDYIGKAILSSKKFFIDNIVCGQWSISQNPLCHQVFIAQNLIRHFEKFWLFVFVVFAKNHIILAPILADITTLAILAFTGITKLFQMLDIVFDGCKFHIAIAPPLSLLHKLFKSS